MAADSDTPSHDSNICLGMDSSRTLKKPDEPSPRNWAGNIRLGDLPILWRLVGSSKVEGEEEIVRAIEGYGTFSYSIPTLYLHFRLTTVVPPLDWSLHRSSGARTDTPRTDALRISSCPVCVVCIGSLYAACRLLYINTSKRTTRRKRL